MSALFWADNSTVVAGAFLTCLSGAVILLDARFGIWLIAAVTFAIPAYVVESEFIVPIFGINWYAMDWLLFFTLLSNMIRWSSGSNIVRRTRLTFPVLAFLVIVILGIFVGIRLGNEMRSVFADARLFLYYGSFFLCVSSFRSFRDFRILLWVILVSSVLGAVPQILWSLSSSMTDLVTGQHYQFGRITGTQEVSYPVVVAASLSILVFSRSIIQRAVVIPILAVSFIALVLSYTRGSWLALIASLAFLAVILLGNDKARSRSVKTILIFTIFISGMLLLLDLYGVVSVGSIFLRLSLLARDRLDISALSRLSEWQEALRAFARHPIFGAGLGYMFHFYAIGIGWNDQTYIHNSYIYVLAKMGVVGAIAFTFLLARTVWIFSQTIRRMDAGPEMGIVLAYGGMFLVFIFKSATTWHLNALFESTFVGVLFASLANFADSPEIRRR